MKKQIRSNFRNQVFKRDKNKCRLCRVNPAVDAHHITDRHDMPNGGYVLSNGISLCGSCHLIAEEYHVTKGKTGITPESLYNLIGSSYEEAFKESRKLSPTAIES